MSAASGKEHSKGPLSGYRIIEFGAYFTLPLAAMWLADQGADVIKVEAPEGDLVRYVFATRRSAPSMSGAFANLNRNKRSIVLDMKQPSAIQAFKELVKNADVVMQNFRPGVMERLTLGYEDLKKIKSDIIFVSVSGFGTEGPYAKQRVFDQVVQATSGMANAQRIPGTNTPDLVKTTIADKVTSQVIFQAITAALLGRANTGEGQHVQINMLNALLSFLWPDTMSNHTLVGDGVKLSGSMSNMRCIYETSDGHLLTYGSTNADWASLCDAVGKPHLTKDSRFADAADRFKNAPAVYEELKDCFRDKTTDEWMIILRQHDTVCAPVNSLEDVHLDPQVKALNLLVESEHPSAGTYRQPKHPVQFEKTPASIRRHAPMLGEQTDEILREAGLSDSQIENLRKEGAAK